VGNRANITTERNHPQASSADVRCRNYRGVNRRQPGSSTPLGNSAMASLGRALLNGSLRRGQGKHKMRGSGVQIGDSC
jgi:hypothetical protein